ncbi:MAG: domain containing protein [Acidimicrobiaceae bacterium]|nr:domain containing protein [Acidimicrobiaceae bacterium]
MSERIRSDEERIIARVLVRGLVHIALDDISSAQSSLREERSSGGVENPESIRLLRIAIRRIEYQIMTMSEVDPSLETHELIHRLHQVGGPFGELRDTEIISERVVKALGERRRTLEGQRLVALIMGQRSRAQSTSDDVLESGELRSVLDALNEFRRLLPSDAITPAMARPVAQQAVRVTWRTVKRVAKLAKKSGADDDLHKLRRTAKRAIYSTRGFSYVLGPSSEEFAARLVVLQKTLGRQHDRVIVSEWLRDAAESDASLKLLANEVSREERQRADDGADEWAGPWKMVRELRPEESVMTTYSFFE